jgi:hypothetical protein
VFSLTGVITPQQQGEKAMVNSSDLCRACGIPTTTLNTWIERGVIVPEVMGGRGRGNAHRFTRMQAVGIAVAVKLFQSFQGCRTEYVGAVVSAFASTPEEVFARPHRIRGDVERLPVWFVCLDIKGRPLLTRKDYDWQINTKAAYEAMKKLDQDRPVIKRLRPMGALV